ncbi:MAG: glycosyltransferase family 2 protein [Clostridia bacterium]|nr:glycosyltransferase family 2 protein [Clostridia bacterium]
MKLVAIVTPTYNRAYILPKLFESLVNQTSKNFKWYIIDDGSKDNTEEVVKTFVTKDFEIEYHKKENGGKHTAVNFALDILSEDLTFIVDSDDTLTPDAIETIEKDWPEIKDQKDIAGFSYEKAFPDGKLMGQKYKQDVFVDTYIHARVNNKLSGDKAEVYKSEVFKKFKFPVFEGENFISEAVVWCAIGREYKLKFINKIIYVGEYLPDGLTASAKTRILANPRGAVAVYTQLSKKPVNLKNRMKYTIAYIAYSREAKIKLKEQYKNANSKFLYIMLFLPGLLAHFVLKKKFGKKKNGKR